MRRPSSKSGLLTAVVVAVSLAVTATGPLDAQEPPDLSDGEWQGTYRASFLFDLTAMFESGIAEDLNARGTFQATVDGGAVTGQYEQSADSVFVTDIATFEVTGSAEGELSGFSVEPQYRPTIIDVVATTPSLGSLPVTLRGDEIPPGTSAMLIVKATCDQAFGTWTEEFGAMMAAMGAQPLVGEDAAGLNTWFAIKVTDGSDDSINSYLERSLALGARVRTFAASTVSGTFDIAELRAILTDAETAMSDLPPTERCEEGDAESYFLGVADVMYTLMKSIVVNPGPWDDLDIIAVIEATTRAGVFSDAGTLWRDTGTLIKERIESSFIEGDRPALVAWRDLARDMLLDAEADRAQSLIEELGG